MTRPVKPVCSTPEQHTPNQPRDYIGWSEWAARMARTHKQVHCPGCGRLEIWVPKTTKENVNA